MKITFRKRAVKNILDGLKETDHIANKADNMVLISQVRDEEGNWETFIDYHAESLPHLVYALSKGLHMVNSANVEDL